MERCDTYKSELMEPKTELEKKLNKKCWDMSSELHKAKMEVSKMKSCFAEIASALRTREKHLNMSFERVKPVANNDMVRILVTGRCAREIINYVEADRKLFGL